MDAAARRLVSFGIVAVFHLIMIYAFYAGLLHQMVAVPAGPIDTKLIEEKLDKKELPPPPPPKNFIPPPPSVVMPIVSMETEAAPTNTITVTPPRPRPVVAPPAPAVEVGPRQIPGHKNAHPEYPATSVRLKEEGTTVLQIYIDENGSVADAKVEQSSGSQRLDDAAIRGVKSRGPNRWKYIPKMKDGKPIGDWTTVSIKWELKLLGY